MGLSWEVGGGAFTTIPLCLEILLTASLSVKGNRYLLLLPVHKEGGRQHKVSQAEPSLAKALCR